MKKARMNISHSRFILSKLKIFGEIVTTKILFKDFKQTENDVHRPCTGTTRYCGIIINLKGLKYKQFRFPLRPLLILRAYLGTLCC